MDNKEANLISDSSTIRNPSLKYFKIEKDISLISDYSPLIFDWPKSTILLKSYSRIKICRN